MAVDLAHWYGNDLNSSAAGDLLTVDGVDKNRQRLLRRLLTNPGDYIFEPTYGAGLAAKIGQPFSAQACAAIIKSQMFLESFVARDPAPAISVTQLTNGLSVQIQYFDSSVGQNVPLSFTVTPPGS
jgi:phage baseplate assembly protein W